MPRKYRPPASSKRRKPRTVEYDFPTPPEDAADDAAIAEEEEYEEGDDVDYASEPVIEVRTPAGRNIADRPERHVRRDYSYVRNDVVRIGIFAAVLIVAIVIGGIIR